MENKDVIFSFDLILLVCWMYVIFLLMMDSSVLLFIGCEPFVMKVRWSMSVDSRKYWGGRVEFVYCTELLTPSQTIFWTGRSRTSCIVIELQWCWVVCCSSWVFVVGKFVCSVTCCMVACTKFWTLPDFPVNQHFLVHCGAFWVTSR